MKHIIISIVILTGLAVAVPSAMARVPRLGWHEAKQEAILRGLDFPVPGGNEGDTKTNWASRFGPYEIDYGVESDGTQTTRTYDPCKTISYYSGNCIGGYDYDTEDTWCMATVDVFKATRDSRWHYRGEIYSRIEDDMSCVGS